MDQGLKVIINEMESYLSLHLINGLNLYEKYKKFHKNSIEQIKGIMIVEDPYLKKEKSVVFELYDGNNVNDPLIRECLAICLFFVNELLIYRKSTVQAITTEISNPNKKKEIIECYIDDIYKLDINNSIILKVIKKFAMSNMVILTDKDNVDLLLLYNQLSDLIGMTSTEDIFIKFTLWRLTNKISIFEGLIKDINTYITENMYEYRNSHICANLFKDLSEYNHYDKAVIMISWYGIIAELANQAFDKFYKFGWIKKNSNILNFDYYHYTPKDISSYFLMTTSFAFNNKKQAIDISGAIIGYYKLLKSLDILQILGEICRLYNEDDMTPYKMAISIKKDLQKLLFENEIDYELTHKKYDVNYLSTVEINAKEIEEAMESLIIFLDNIETEDITCLMQAKHEFMDKIEKYISTDTKSLLNDHMNGAANKIKELLSKENEFDSFYESVMESFDKYNNFILKHRDIFKSLSTAEMLYQMYIYDKDEIVNFDYSCISIMYYMSLEDFVNKLIYIPYKNKVLQPNIKEIAINSKYLVSPKNYFRNGKLKNSCELGTLSYLLMDIYKTEKFKLFIKNLYNLRINKINQLKDFGEKLKITSVPRNNAAHGGNYISYDEAKSDKTDVYITHSINEIRGLIFELLNILFD